MSNKDLQKYEVGYKRPPREHQFKPGQSGNPKGRPKKNNNFAEDVMDEMNEVITIQENGKLKKITKKDIFIHFLTFCMLIFDTNRAIFQRR